MSEFNHENSIPLRFQLVTQFRERGILREDAVENAFLVVPRELFVPEIVATEGVEGAYRNEPLMTKVRGRQTVSTSSQPSLMVQMLQFLQPWQGKRILEIGTGTGYNAALLAHLVGPSGKVVTVELEADLSEQAKKNLQTLGLDDRVEVIAGDGWQGYTPFAPYDAIIVTAHADDIAPTWIDQLKIGGRLVLPLFLSPSNPVVVAFRNEEQRLESFKITNAIFLRMQGEHQVQEHSMWDNSSAVIIKDEENQNIIVQMGSDSWREIEPERKAALLGAWLSGGEVVELDEEIDSYASLASYMQLRYGQDKLCQVRLFYDHNRLGSNRKAGIGFIELEHNPLSLALLIQPDHMTEKSSSVLLCGPNAKKPLATLNHAIKEWQELGSIGYEDLQIHVHKGDTTPELEPNSWTVPLRTVTLVLRHTPAP